MTSNAAVAGWTGPNVASVIARARSASGRASAGSQLHRLGGVRMALIWTLVLAPVAGTIAVTIAPYPSFHEIDTQTMAHYRMVGTGRPRRDEPWRSKLTSEGAV